MYVEGELIKDIEREQENESYPCDACDGLGYHDIAINEYDVMERECTKCDGTGRIKGDYDYE